MKSTREKLTSLLDTRIILLDGAMGTMIQQEKLEEEVDKHIDGRAEKTKEEIDKHAEKIKEGKGGEIYGMVIHLLQAGLTVYSVVSYWYHYMPNLEGKDMKTHILCRATHMSMMPLFKPVSISMWPALMPLIQLLHWTFLCKCCTVDGCAADADGGAGRNRILENIQQPALWTPCWELKEIETIWPPILVYLKKT